MYQKNFTSFNSVQYFLRNDQKCTKKWDFFCPKYNAQKMGFNGPEKQTCQKMSHFLRYTWDILDHILDHIIAHNF